MAAIIYVCILSLHRFIKITIKEEKEITMPFTMLDEEKERRIVDTVFEKLYTPYGLRTLARQATTALLTPLFIK